MGLDPKGESCSIHVVNQRVGVEWKPTVQTLIALERIGVGQTMAGNLMSSVQLAKPLLVHASHHDPALSLHWSLWQSLGCRRICFVSSRVTTTMTIAFLRGSNSFCRWRQENTLHDLSYFSASAYIILHGSSSVPTFPVLFCQPTCLSLLIPTPRHPYIPGKASCGGRAAHQRHHGHGARDEIRI